MFRKLSFFYLILLISSQAHAAMLASDQNGNLVSIDLVTGNGTLIGQELNHPLATEIEYDNISGILYGNETNGNLNLHTINPATGLSKGFVTHGPAAFNGMEFVGNTLYVTNIKRPGGLSMLETIDPATGVQTIIGATGLGPISGLAYDSANSTMYDVTAGGLPGMLATIDLLTGIANPGSFYSRFSGNSAHVVLEASSSAQTVCCTGAWENPEILIRVNYSASH